MTDIDVERHEAQRAVGQFMTYANICWCGVPEDFLRLLLEQLNTRFEGDGRAKQDTADRLLKEPLNLTFAVLMDCWELTEHGSSIYGAWLTRGGVRLRDALRRLDLGDEHRNSTDLDELNHSHEDGWWQREHRLHPKTTPDGAPFAEFGVWDPER